MALARKIAYNVVLNSFLKVFSTVVLSLLSIRLITGYLGQEGFGEYSTVLAFFAFFSAMFKSLKYTKNHPLWLAEIHWYSAR